MSVSSFLVPLIERIMKRPVAVDPDVPVRVVVARVLSTMGGLVRGLLLTRRALVLGRGARVVDVARLHLDGGLVRIEEYCRIDCASREGIRLGRNFKLGAFSRMIASGTLAELGKGIRVGDNVGIGEFAYIGGAGGVKIGANTIVGQYFGVHPESHRFDDPMTLIREQGVTRQGIEVGEGCWVGSRVTVLDGVTIGRNCVIAAGSVVTRSFPDDSVIGGVPARFLRSRVDRSNEEGV